MLVLTQEVAKPEALPQPWGVGLVLLLLVFFLTVMAWILRSRLKMKAEL